MMRFNDCADTSLVGLDDVLDFTQPLVRMENYCNLSELDFQLYIGFGTLLIALRTSMTVIHWRLWLAREKHMKQPGKRFIVDGRTRNLPLFPLLSTFGCLIVILFVLLTYFGLARGSNGISLMMLNSFPLVLGLMAIITLRKNIGMQRRLGNNDDRHPLEARFSFGFVLYMISLIINGILAMSFDIGHPRWFQISFMLFALLYLIVFLVVSISLNEVALAIAAKSTNVNHIKSVRRIILKQQVGIGLGALIGATLWIGMAFLWRPTWQFALTSISLESLVLGIMLYALHVKSRRRPQTTAAVAGGEGAIDPAVPEGNDKTHAVVNNPIAAPSSMFLASNFQSNNNLAGLLGDDARNNNYLEGTSPASTFTYQFRTLVIPSLDTIVGRFNVGFKVNAEASQGRAVAAAVCLLIILGMSDCLMISAFVVDPHTGGRDFAIIGFCLFASCSLGLFSTSVSLRVLTRLLSEPAIWFRTVLFVIWAINLSDVVEWDTRCLSVIGLFLQWSLIAVEDAAIQSAKMWAFPILSVFSVLSSLATFSLIKFDLLFLRSDHVLQFFATSQGASSNVISWSPYQAAGDFNIVVCVILIADLFHIGHRRGLTYLHHFKGAIYVCIAPLDGGKSPKAGHTRPIAGVHDIPVTSTSSSPPSDEAAATTAPMMMRQISNVERHENNNLQLADIASVKAKRGLLVHKTSSIPVNTIILREVDSVAVRILGVERASRYLFWLGKPAVRALYMWTYTLPLTIWVTLVLPGIIPEEFSLLSILTLMMILMRGFMLKNVHMIKVILTTKKFWMRTLLICTSLGFFAHMLLWDIRTLTVLVMLFLGIDYQLGDARCVFFVKAAKRRSYDQELQHWTGRLATVSYAIATIIFFLTVVALPLVISLGFVTNARINAFIPLRPEAAATSGSSTSGTLLIRGSLARLNLFQVVSDFLLGLCTIVALDILQDIRLSTKMKTRRIQLKGFHAYVHPIFVSTGNDESQPNQQQHPTLVAAEADAEIVHDPDEGNVNRNELLVTMTSTASSHFY